MLSHPGHDPFLHVKAVFGLLEDRFGVLLKHVLADFFSAIRGEAVEDNMSLRGLGQQFTVQILPGQQ